MNPIDTLLNLMIRQAQLNISPMYNNMKWSNLLQNKCPMCSRSLGYSNATGLIVCVDDKAAGCTFSISPEKMNDITTGIVCDQIDEDDQNEKTTTQGQD